MSTEEITWLPGWRLRELMLGRKLSPVEVTEHFLTRIASHDRTLHSFTFVAEETARQDAREAEHLIMTRPAEELGPLFGVPISIKDLHEVAAMPCRYGSLVYRDHVPAEDCEPVRRVRAAGAIIVGKTATPEFGNGFSAWTRLGPETVNPWDRGRSPGGSSSGAGACLATGLTPLALGSDTGGSIRVPAAWCGVFGLRPGVGTVPRGDDKDWSLVSTTGPMTRDVGDAAILLDVLAGGSRVGSEARRHHRLAWWDEAPGIPLDADVVEVARRAACRFEETGALVERASLELPVDQAKMGFGIIAGVETWVAVGKQVVEDLETRALLAPATLEVWSYAQRTTATDFVQALRLRHRYRRLLEGLFATYDLILTPTVGITALPLEARALDAMRAVLHFVTPFSFAGVPAATLPCGRVGGLPVGLQVVGPPGGEDIVLSACRDFEQLQPWDGQRPPGFT